MLLLTSLLVFQIVLVYLPLKPILSQAHWQVHQHFCWDDLASSLRCSDWSDAHHIFNLNRGRWTVKSKVNDYSWKDKWGRVSRPKRMIGPWKEVTFLVGDKSNSAEKKKKVGATSENVWFITEADWHFSAEKTHWRNETVLMKHTCKVFWKYRF